MRTLRGLLTTAVALACMTPSIAEAQQGRRFENAWFWGLKGGGMLYSTNNPTFDDQGSLASFDAQNRHSAVIGAEWLITRTRGGLYVSFDQGFLDATTAFRSSADPDTAVVFLGLKNTRRANFAGMFFPPVRRWVQPYVGLGFAYMQVGRTTTLNGNVLDAEERAAFETYVVEHKSQFQPLGIFGVQARLRPFSVFLQGSATPFNDDFVLRGGRTSVMTYELGIRYNIGSSIDRL